MKWYGLEISQKVSIILTLLIVGAFVVIFVILRQPIYEDEMEEAQQKREAILMAPFDRMDVPDVKEFVIVPVGQVRDEIDKGLEGLAFELEKDAVVLSAGDGTVLQVADGIISGMQRVSIDHGEGLETVYDLVKDAKVNIGQAVTAGQEIARAAGVVDGGANSTFVFQLKLDGVDVCPEQYVNDWTKELWDLLLRQSQDGQGASYDVICY